MKLCEKLIKLRRERGLTQEELAARIFVTRTAVSKWENDRGYPGIDSLKLLAKFYGISLDELVSEEDVAAVRRDKERRSRAFYWCAAGCLAAAAAFTLAAGLAKIPWLFVPSAVFTLGYVAFAFASKPSLSGMPRARFVRYIAARAVVLAIVVGVMITELVRLV